MRFRPARALSIGLVVAVASASLSCDVTLERMKYQQKLVAFAQTPYFPNGSVEQKPPAGTVAANRIIGPSELTQGTNQAGTFVARVPIAVDRALLQRGRDRFEIFCGACHGVLGNGKTMVAQNMVLRPPPSLVDSPTRDLPPGRVYQVITQGYGLMPSYAGRIGLRDRWAIVAYLQALKISQRVELDRLPPTLRREAARWLK